MLFCWKASNSEPNLDLRDFKILCLRKEPLVLYHYPNYQEKVLFPALYVYDTTLLSQKNDYSESLSDIEKKLVFIRKEKWYLGKELELSHPIYNFDESNPKTIYFSIRNVNGEKILLAKILKGRYLMNENE